MGLPGLGGQVLPLGRRWDLHQQNSTRVGTLSRPWSHTPPAHQGRLKWQVSWDPLGMPCHQAMGMGYGGHGRWEEGATQRWVVREGQ